MTRGRTAAGLTVLLVLAGCGAGGGPPGSDLTVTPAPVPTDGPPTPALRHAPGITGSGVVDPLALTSTHATLLRKSPFRVRVEERVERPGRPNRRRVFQGTFAGRTAYLVTMRELADNRPDRSRTFYADGSALYERLEAGSRVRYYLTTDRLHDESPYPPSPLGSRTQRDQLYMALLGAATDYDGVVDVNGTAHHRIVGSGTARPDVLASWEFVDAFRRYEFAALVTADGLVRTYRIEYVALDDGHRVRVVRTGRWSHVGNATVPVPAWYDAARRATGG